MPVVDGPKADAAGRMPEADLQAAVVELAQWRGWLCFHPYDSRRSQPGFPDLVLTRGGRLIFAELKTAKGSLRREQTEWIRRLREVPGIEVHLWRPEHWRSGDIDKALAE